MANSECVSQAYPILKLKQPQILSDEDVMSNFYWLQGKSLLWALLTVTIVGCANHQVSRKSSVMDYLYPDSDSTFEKPSVPHLKLPLRVGVAFVPGSGETHRPGSLWVSQSYSGGMPAAKKNEILETVSDNFRGLDFVSSIEVIPTSYLTSGGSFANLSQIKTMYGIDVIALVSYDQVQFTDEGMLSLSYWTIVGAYVVSGEKNDTSTLMDTVVYDISSKKMLFRAPGTSQVVGRSTRINASEELRADSIEGFERAAEAMAVNLESQLITFKDRIKDNPSQVKVSHRQGYSGGAANALDIVLLGLLATMVAIIKFYKPRYAVAVK